MLPRDSGSLATNVRLRPALVPQRLVRDQRAAKAHPPRTGRHRTHSRTTDADPPSPASGAKGRPARHGRRFARLVVSLREAPSGRTLHGTSPTTHPLRDRNRRLRIPRQLSRRLCARRLLRVLLQSTLSQTRAPFLPRGFRPQTRETHAESADPGVAS